MDRKQAHRGVKRAGAACLVLCAALAAFAAGARAEGTSGAVHVRASVDFGIVIPAIVRARALSQPIDLPISEGDISRGYVDLDGATSLVLTSNSAAGYAVSVAYDPRLVSRVTVRIQGASLEAASQGGWLHVDAPKLIETPLRVGYRLYLAAHAHAGTYRWPVALAFAPGA